MWRSGRSHCTGRVHADLAKRLDELEQRTEVLALPHDTFSRNTRNQL